MNCSPSWINRNNSFSRGRLTTRSTSGDCDKLSSARSQIELQLRIALEISTALTPIGVMIATAIVGLEAVIDVIRELGFVLITEHLLAKSLAVSVRSPIF